MTDHPTLRASACPVDDVVRTGGARAGREYGSGWKNWRREPCFPQRASPLLAPPLSSLLLRWPRRLGALHPRSNSPRIRLRQAALRRLGPDNRHRGRLRRPEDSGRSAYVRPGVRPAGPFLHQSDAAGTPASADSDWAGEIDLDVEWAHAIAPKAKILLVEAASSSDADLSNAVDYARKSTGRRGRVDELGRQRVFQRTRLRYDVHHAGRTRRRRVRGVGRRQRSRGAVAGRVAQRAGRRRHRA